jgi:hypothetical protein
MKSLSGIIAVTTLVVLGLGAAASAQDDGRARRRAQPRAAAPRSEPAPTAAPAPPRQERAEARGRGTDNRGRVRVPREATGDPEQGYDSARREPRERAAERVAPAAPVTAARTERRREPVNERERTVEAPGETLAAAPAASASGGDQDERRRAVPRGSRPRGDNPVVGRAEPRTGPAPRDGRGGRDYPGSWGGSRVYSSRHRVYNNYYYYYPRRWYPYGYGAFGLGYFYYDPYTWYSYDPYYRPHAYYRYGTYDSYYYATGELRLQVRPHQAEVYVDGYFAGHVDDFDGMFQGLRLEEGGHTIEIVAPGFEPLVFDVRILPGRKTTYRGELRPRP